MEQLECWSGKIEAQSFPLNQVLILVFFFLGVGNEIHASFRCLNPWMSCKVWDWILHASNYSLWMDYEVLLEKRESIGRTSRSSSSPSEDAVLCTTVVPVWSGDELLRAQLPASSRLSYTAEILWFMAWCIPERVKEGTRVCPGGCLRSSHKVWLQSRTGVPKLELNQPAWELRVMQVQLSKD